MGLSDDHYTMWPEVSAPIGTARLPKIKTDVCQIRREILALDLKSENAVAELRNAASRVDALSGHLFQLANDIEGGQE